MQGEEGLGLPGLATNVTEHGPDTVRLAPMTIDQQQIPTPQRIATDFINQGVERFP
jgi:hypothetical protein